jgi:hypothetical protein
MIDNKRWTPYYTPKKLAAEILKLIPSNFRPEVVVDICAGSGNFLESALDKKWSNAKYLAFDISTNKKLQNENRLDFTKLNSLDTSKLIEKINVRKTKLVLANPPFGPYNQKLSFKTNTNRKRLSQLFIEANKIPRIEAKMLYANLSIMKSGDIFAAILPENIFSSQTFATFKNEFLSHFSIIKLGRPSKYFNSCEVRTRIFVGILLNKKIKLKKRNSSKKTSSLQIIRGIDNSKLLNEERTKESVREVLHFNNPKGYQEKQKYIEFDIIYNKKIVSKKDLLVIRVGRHAGKAFNPRPSFLGKLFSDHFFLIKDTKLTKSGKISFEKKLQINLKGLTTRYIDKKSIERALNSIS